MCRLGLSSSDPASEHSPGKCPFTIRPRGRQTYLIRENDVFREHPHIYAKICSTKNEQGTSVSVIVLSDTGVGTALKNPTHGTKSQEWTIKSFLESTINPDSNLPYLILLSHCHYDHILGLQHLDPSTMPEKRAGTYSDRPGRKADITLVLSSSLPSFVTPYSVLNEHSLCEAEGLTAPRYEADIWADDQQRLVYRHFSGVHIDLGITTLHTPGHTPDSLSWYDIQARTLYVGDSLYQQESRDTHEAPWGTERPMPVIFPKEGDLFAWWQSVKKLIIFVERENHWDPNSYEGQARTRVQLAAGHVTSSTDAHVCLVGAKDFVARILRNDVPCIDLPERRRQPTGHWIDDISDRTQPATSNFSVVAPIAVVAKARETIPRPEWT